MRSRSWFSVGTLARVLLYRPCLDMPMALAPRSAPHARGWVPVAQPADIIRNAVRRGGATDDSEEEVYRWVLRPIPAGHPRHADGARELPPGIRGRADEGFGGSGPG